MAQNEIRDKTDFNLFPDNLAEKYRLDDLKVINTGKSLYIGEEEMVVNGTTLIVTTRKVPLKGENNSIVGLIGLVFDITERKFMEDELKKYRNELEKLVEERTNELAKTNVNLKNEITLRTQTESLLKFEREQLVSIYDSITGLIYVSDLETHEILYANNAMKNKFKRELIGGICHIELQGMESPCEFCTNEIILKSKGMPYQWEYHNFLINRDFLVIDKIIKWPDGRDVRFEFAIDITERKQMEYALSQTNEELEATIEELNVAEEEIRHNYEKFKYLSMHDSLTGLYNREYFEEEIHRLEGGRDNPICIIVCDVDGLKLVNDTLGHISGDNILIDAAGVLKESFREGDVVARIGGDEFAIILSKSDAATAEKSCCRIQDAIKQHNSNNPRLPLSISTGFAINNQSIKNLNEVFKEADNNMYREKLHRNQSARSAIVQTLMKMLEARDLYTEGHAVRLQELVANLAYTLGLSEHKISDLRLLAQFHDIGKVGIPDCILLKPGHLTFEEFKEMHRHCEIGHHIAQSSPDLSPIADWILKHHERWDGQGYPLGLKEEEIPLECRILAIADAYDAMTSDRPYRKAMPYKEAIAELNKCSASQFDPTLVPLFVSVLG